MKYTHPSSKRSSLRAYFRSQLLLPARKGLRVTCLALTQPDTDAPNKKVSVAACVDVYDILSLFLLCPFDTAILISYFFCLCHILFSCSCFMLYFRVCLFVCVINILSSIL